jgi:hypothetical protein
MSSSNYPFEDHEADYGRETLGVAMENLAAGAAGLLRVGPSAPGPEILRRRAQRLMAEADRLQTELDVRAAKYEAAGPEPADGSVVRFDKQHQRGGPIYSYAALRKRDRWFITQGAHRPNGPVGSMTWHQLIDFAGGVPIRPLLEFGGSALAKVRDARDILADTDVLHAKRAAIGVQVDQVIRLLNQALYDAQ